MLIGFASADWGYDTRGDPTIPGGAGWVRVHTPARALAALGHTVAVGNNVGVLADGRLIVCDHNEKPLVRRPPEVVVVQRWMNRHAVQSIRDASNAGQAIVQDVDDWFWGLDPANRAHRTTSVRTDREHNREHYRASVAAADVVTVSTEFLARRIRERFGVRTALLRNVIDLPMFTPRPVRPLTEGLVVGWVGALAWRSGDLETLRGVLGPWLTATRSTFVHHGTFAGDPDTAADRLGLGPELVGPSRRALPPVDYPDNMGGFDIGIVPLSDIPFNRAKSWIKGLEYAASGIPFVAADLPEYRLLDAGLLASTPAQWTAALERLRDPDERQRQSRRGLAAARAHDVRARISEWEATYEAALARKARR